MSNPLELALEALEAAPISYRAPDAIAALKEAIRMQGKPVADTIESLRARVAELEAALNADWGDRVMQENLAAKYELAALKAGQDKPAYWLAGTGDLYSSVAIAKKHGAHEPYIPLFTHAPTIPDVDWLSNIIRKADGNHTLGAGVLAEKIVEAMLSAAPEYKGMT